MLNRFKRSLFVYGVALISAISLQSASSQSWKQADESRLLGEPRVVRVYTDQSLYDIARREGYALEHLAEANSLPVSLATVQKSEVILPSLRILPDSPPQNGIVVNIPERGFYVFQEEKKARFFPLAFGEPGRFETPTGNFSIREKVVDPEWIAPDWAGLGDDNIIPPGPDNPLGDRWIGLTSAGLGMHSTNNPSSIGSATSHGCMRMYPEIAHTVFDLVETGWPVRIEYETSRVSLEPEGIFVSCFSDPYHKGGRKEQLIDQFRQHDLLGFLQLIEWNALLNKKDGLVTRVVDLTPRVDLPNGSRLQAARIGEKVFLEGGTLAGLGIEQEFRLAERVVILKRADETVVLPMRFGDGQAAKSQQPATQAFLSRGTSWFPVRESLQPFAVNYVWDNSSKRLKVL